MTVVCFISLRSIFGENTCNYRIRSLKTAELMYVGEIRPDSPMTRGQRHLLEL